MTDAQLFPRWVTRPDGAKLVVNSREEYRAHMGVEFDANPPSVASDEEDPLGIHAEE